MTLSASDRLTEAHRLAQARLGARTVAQLLAVWSLLDPTDLDATTRRWLRVAVPVVQRQASLSMGLAADYTRTLRAVELGTLAGFPTVSAAAADPAAIAASLTVTGPVKVKQQIATGRLRAAAMELGASTSSASGMRHAMNGGRQQIIDTVTADPKAHGYSRVTSGKPCAFCVMLSSRGAVYGTQASAAFRAHDSCHCQAKPSYRPDAPLPLSVQRNRELWVQAKAVDGDDPLNALRRSLDA